MGWHCRYNFSGKATVGAFSITMMTALLEYLDLPLYIEKLMMIISFTHKLILAAAHWPG